jgi:hypothetical protein
MAPITVDPEALASAGKSVGAVGEEIAAAVNALASGLSGGAPTGLDDAGLAFGISYQKSAQALLDAAEAAVKAGRGIGFGVQMSATNYSRADAASTIGGGSSPLTAPTAPGDFSAPACPPSLGGGVPPPFLWGMVQAFIPDVWPDGEPARLTAAATAWDTFATTINSIAGEFAGPSGVIGAQQIPEGDAMTSAISELSQSLSQIASEAGKLATQTREFADDVAHTQNAIGDLLDRVSPSGFLDGITAVLSGDALDELKEIAEDIKTVLGGFGRQVEGRTQLLQQLIDWIDGSVVSTQKWARKEFTHYLGEDVGGLAANVFEFQTNVGEGFIKAGIESIQSIEQLDPTRFAYDFDGATATWGALADTAKYADPMYALTHPIGAFEHGKGMLSGLVHAEDWRADRPGLGVGGLGFEVASSVTGVGAAKTATKGAVEAAETAAEHAAPELRAMSGTAAEVSSIGENTSKITEKLDNLDNFPTGGALPGSHGPTIPPSLTGPKAPVAPHIPEMPAPRGVAESRVPHSSAPTATPAHTPEVPGETPHTGTPPIGGTAESRVPTAGEVQSAPHQSAPAPSANNVPTNSAAPIAPHAPETSPTVDAPATHESAVNAPHADSTSGSAPQTPPGDIPDGNGSHGTDSGNPVSGHPNSDGPPDPADAPNHPPHTGLHDPPANHAPPGAQLPDLTDINKEYRRPDGTVDPNRFHEWAEMVAEAYPTITKDGVEGVYTYTTEKYDGMNPYLRNIDALTPEQSDLLGAPSISEMTDARRASWEAEIRKTDEGLAALPPYRTDPDAMTSTTWRGIQASDSLLDQLKMGDTFSDPGYLSTSTSPHLAELFARANPDATPTLVTVLGRDGVDVKDLSRYIDESEILFPRNTQFEVVFRETGDDGLLRITLRQKEP